MSFCLKHETYLPIRYKIVFPLNCLFSDPHLPFRTFRYICTEKRVFHVFPKQSLRELHFAWMLCFSIIKKRLSDILVTGLTHSCYRTSAFSVLTQIRQQNSNTVKWTDAVLWCSHHGKVPCISFCLIQGQTCALFLENANAEKVSVFVEPYVSFKMQQSKTFNVGHWTLQVLK